jgi:alpha,alpha-trehalase
LIDRRATDGVILDVDGVVTDTATVHAAAWKAVFDEVADEPFRLPEDYRAYVDGKPRYDGVSSFLASRGITLPYGSPDDAPGRDTVCAIGNRKDRCFLDLILRDGVRAFPDALRLLDRLAAAGIPVAAVSASRNCEEVLRAAGVNGRFGVRVDGVIAEHLRLRGKPDPAIFLEAARRLEVEPARAVVVEDAVAGAEAGRRGGFGLVVGVARSGAGDDLRRAGADVVVGSLDDVGLR